VTGAPVSKQFEIPEVINATEIVVEEDGELDRHESIPVVVEGFKRKLWVDVVADNRNPSKGLSMQYVAPTVTSEGIEITIDEEDVESEVRYWESSLILYAMGEDLSMNMVKTFMEKMWNFVKLPDMHYHDDGYFILRFKTVEDRDLVLQRGPYTLRNIPLMLKEWKVDFDLKRDMLRTMPLWVKLPKLPLHLWSASSLSKITSAIGVPIASDECTANKLRVSYARILVEVDITKELIKEIAIKDREGRKLIQYVEYEWKPMFCEKCKIIGHRCKETMKKLWKPKDKPPEPTKSSGSKSSLHEAEVVKQKEDVDEGIWIKSGASIKDKGKHAIDYSSGIDCVNGFGALGDLNDLLLPIDSGPC
jgi:hypothetical protein